MSSRGDHTTGNSFQPNYQIAKWADWLVQLPEPPATFTYQDIRSVINHGTELAKPEWFDGAPAPDDVPTPLHKEQHRRLPNHQNVRLSAVFRVVEDLHNNERNRYRIRSEHYEEALERTTSDGMLPCGHNGFTNARDIEGVRCKRCGAEHPKSAIDWGADR